MSARCVHATRVLLQMVCGAGGIQYRRYCTTCWCAGPALPHSEIDRPEDVPLADPELIAKARNAFWRAAR